MSDSPGGGSWLCPDSVGWFPLPGLGFGGWSWLRGWPVFAGGVAAVGRLGALRATGGGRLVLVVLPVRACGGLRFPGRGRCGRLGGLDCGGGGTHPRQAQALAFDLAFDLGLCL